MTEERIRISFRLNRHFSASTAPDISRQAVLEAITGQALISTP
jgi:hypothetical protein